MSYAYNRLRVVAGHPVESKSVMMIEHIHTLEEKGQRGTTYLLCAGRRVSGRGCRARWQCTTFTHNSIDPETRTRTRACGGGVWRLCKGRHHGTSGRMFYYSKNTTRRTKEIKKRYTAYTRVLATVSIKCIHHNSLASRTVRRRPRLGGATFTTTSPPQARQD